MNSAFKIVLISIFGVFLFLASPAWASENNLVVQFEEMPLFNEANFLPGQGVTRWVKVTNNSGQTQRIATEAINTSDPDNLGAVLNLEIKEGGNTLYNNPFSTFFNVGEVFLSNLAGNGANTQYDFTVSFYPGTQNSFQGKTLSFDILVGFQGEEGGLLPGAGGGGGGFLPPGLSIIDESVRITDLQETSVTITWTTSYNSTSQVVYAAEGESHTLDLTDNTGAPPKYGYAHTTPEYDSSPKVTAHSVTITGLSPGTKYYYRAISHASFAMSPERSFTTLGALEEITLTETPLEETPLTEAPLEQESELEAQEEIVGEEAGEPGRIIGETIEAPRDLEEEKEESASKGLASMLLANLDAVWDKINLFWLLIIIPVLLFFLVWFYKKRKPR